MIDIKTNPEFLLTVSQDEIVTLDGIEFKVDLGVLDNPDNIYLTTTTSRTEDYNVAIESTDYDEYSFQYRDYIKHFRKPGKYGDAGQVGDAVMLRSEMVDRIKTNSYTIG